VNLAELERYFAAAATSTSGPPADLEQVFKPSPRLSARELMSIYNRGYHFRLLGALESVFERTRRALGEAEFERVGLAYLARHPSEHPAVERVGRHFAEFLSEHAPNNEALADLAALEWARLAALVAPDPARILTASAVDPQTFPNSRLSFVPSLTVLSLSRAALSSFAAHGGAAPAPTEPLPADEMRVKCAVAIWRQRHAVKHEVLGELECAALERARSGATVSQFCAGFAGGTDAEAAERAFGVVSTWFSREWIGE
jgi:hypothetical protein